jgi:hypothetical protein
MSAPRLTASFTVAAVTACAVELSGLVALVTGRWHPGEAMLAHGGIVLALAAWCTSPSCRKDLRLPLLLVLATCFLGPIGSVGTLVAGVTARIYARSATPFEEWYASLFPDVERAPRLPQAAVSGDQGRGSVAPFGDILSFGQLSQKQELLTLIASDFRPEFAHVLRMALNDANNAVRVQAATAIARIEDEFLQRRMRMSAAVLENPLDPSRVWSLATLLDEYANAGIMDREREAAARDEATHAYVDYLQLVGKDAAAQQAIGRLRLRAGDHVGAARWLEQRGDAGSTRPESRLVYMEALFELRRFDDLRNYAATHAQDLLLSDGLPLEARETAKLWAVAGA